MFSSLRIKFNSMRGESKQPTSQRRSSSVDIENKPKPTLPDRQVYSRPEFLQLTQAELKASVNFDTRPIITPNNDDALPLGAGYAECINAGKSKQNEDQAAVGQIKIHMQTFDDGVDGEAGASLCAVYFGVFDGHAGPGAALMVASQLINHLQQKLVEIQEDIYLIARGEAKIKMLPSSVTIDSLITGAIEAAFQAMDEQISQESKSFNISGGCTALVALFILGKLFIANAGDCRAVLYLGNEAIPMSTEFTPEREAQRIQYLGYVRPELLQGLFTYNCFSKYLQTKDIGKSILCRGPLNNGWFYKKITKDDVKPPLVSGEGKRSRLMGMIGVTRVLGDHELFVFSSDVRVKPFLSSVPEVKVFDLGEHALTPDDVLVMGSDGLWDFTTSESVGIVVRKALSSPDFDRNSHNIYTAHEVVKHSRGDNKGTGWQQANGSEASFDDISAFVIPIHKAVEASKLKPR